MKYINATVLSDEPLIIFTGGSWDAPISGSSLLADPLHDRRVIFIILTLWSAESDYQADRLAAFVRHHGNKHPLHSYIVMCNSSGEVKNLGRRGVRSYFGHQNSFVDPNLYKPAACNDKDLMAVYTAQLQAFKRHNLCRDLESVGFIYYNFGPETEPLYETLRQTVPGARFINDELAPPHGGLQGSDVTKVLNRSRVGLCLSAEEGGMHASVEYLLCGLPVVSTPSKGGRDFFFHEDFVEIAEPTPEGVKVAIDNVLARAPSGEEIRSRTMDLQQKQIALFLTFLDKLVKAEGGIGYGLAQWQAHYRDKLLAWASLDDFLSRIPTGPKGGRRLRFRPIDRALVRLRNLRN